MPNITLAGDIDDFVQSNNYASARTNIGLVIGSAAGQLGHWANASFVASHVIVSQGGHDLGRHSFSTFISEAGIRPIGSATATTNLVFEGDSLTAGSVLDPGEDYPAYCMALPSFSDGTKYNVADANNTIAAMTTDYATQVYPLRPTGAVTDAWLFLWVGTNDYLTAVPAATFITDWKAYLTTARADGFRIVVFTVPPSTSNWTGEAIRVAINDGIRQSAGYYDVLVDVDAMFAGAQWKTGDGLHYTAAANQLIAKYLDEALSTLGRPSSPTGVFRGKWDAVNYLPAAATVFKTTTPSGSDTGTIVIAASGDDTSASRGARLLLAGQNAAAFASDATIYLGTSGTFAVVKGGVSWIQVDDSGVVAGDGTGTQVNCVVNAGTYPQFQLKVAGTTKLNFFHTSGGNYIDHSDFFSIRPGGTAALTVASTGIVTLAQALQLTPSADPPGSPGEGMIYADTDHHLYYYDGTTWKQLD